MTIHIVRLGAPRAKSEGLRIGTVRRPPRGVKKSDFAKQDWYDVWYPNLSPSADVMKLALHAQKLRASDPKASQREWRQFDRAFRAEMNSPGAGRTLDLLAALSQHTDFAVGCYCEDEAMCHRSILRALLAGRGARIEPGPAGSD